MKKIVQAFMKVLIIANMKENSVKALVELLNGFLCMIVLIEIRVVKLCILNKIFRNADFLLILV